MSSLPELQREFLRAVLGDGEWRDGAIQVYVSNARANFLGSLKSSFPVVLRLVGADYFAQCVRAFQRAQPSRSGDLQPAGAGFDEYLRGLHRGGEYAYLGDVAKFEWLCQDALLAAAPAPLDLAALKLVPPLRYDALRFTLHPAARLFRSPYPCMRIWQANIAPPEPPVIDLAGGGDELVLLRAGGELQFHALSSGDAAFLQALQAGAAFAGAVEAGTADPSFDAAAVLRRFVRHEIIVGFQ